ncbi:septal ring lytic transglycosylase RlpA family protein [Mariniflexile litorale]|uniref:Probable endolytic peptidoglycan transglycosylase RlpA n=1 Tax=Mariniflexile litorale TaxID=3045158 RepID=A0AAU7EE56_9FLAO|nr:septal ring lytic transglycosylase RlpA family protein [Mariniflexile sp. KMM 9835]MDQ8212072.1 septal ring lytic transglycosylase RlpA family protein [Mariniflexile sp. KMM 9835]
MKLTTQIIGFIGLLIILSSFKSSSVFNTKNTPFNIIQKDSVLLDSITIDSISSNYMPYKENAHASYYHDKFNGRKTASGEKFDNNLYTAAHKTLKFGTKIKVTNTVNGESVIVTVNDRGPFVKNREIDLSKKAFMEIAKYKLNGYLIVHLDILED